MNLRPILDRNRLQQKDVAEGIGVSRQTVYLWVNDLAIPGGENLTNLLAFLQRYETTLSLADLLATTAGLSPAASA